MVHLLHFTRYSEVHMYHTSGSWCYIYCTVHDTLRFIYHTDWSWCYTCCTVEGILRFPYVCHTGWSWCYTYCTVHCTLRFTYTTRIGVVLHLLPCVGVLYGSHTCSLTSRLLAVYQTGWSWTDTESLNPTSLYALDLLGSTPCSLKLTCVAYE